MPSGGLAGISRAVIIRRLSALLIALAMSFAPLGMPAMAEAAPASHDQMSMSGHCDQQPQPDRHHKAADKNCCAAMCLAVVVPAGSAELAQFHPPGQRPRSDAGRRGFLAEIATPPPKLS